MKQQIILCDICGKAASETYTSSVGWDLCKVCIHEGENRNEYEQLPCPNCQPAANRT